MTDRPIIPRKGTHPCSSDNHPGAAAATTTGTPAIRADQTSIGLLVLRLILGVVFVGHGAQELFGWFGGPGLDGTGKFFEFAGFHPGKPLAFLSGLAQFGGGLLLVLGLGASFAGAALIADILGAAVIGRRPVA